MTRDEYLRQLERLLAALPEQERRDALDYYGEYFDAAGPDREAETIRELGSPGTVAEKILEADAPLPKPSGGAAEATPSAAAHPKRGLYVVLIILIVLALLLLFKVLLGSARTATAGPAAASTVVVSSGTEPSGAAQAAQPAAAAASTETASWVKGFGTDVQTLKIELGTANFTLVFDEQAAEVTLEGTGAAENKFRIEETRYGELTVTQRDTDSRENQTIDLILRLPAGYALKSADIEMGTGALELPDLAMDDLEISSGTGTVTAGSLQAKEIQVETGTGSAELRTVQADEISLDTGTGRIEAESLYARQLECSSGTGDLSVGRVEITGSLEVEVGTGEATMTLAGNIDDYDIEGEGGLGGISLDGKPQEASDRFAYNKGSGLPKVELQAGTGTLKLDFAG